MKINSRSIPDSELRAQVRKLEEELGKYCLRCAIKDTSDNRDNIVLWSSLLTPTPFCSEDNSESKDERAKPGQGPEFLRLWLCLKLKNLEMALPLRLSPRNAISLLWHQES